MKQLAQDLKKALLHKNQALALSLFQRGLQDEKKFVAQVRKFGVLRCSNYDFQPQILNSLVNEAEKAGISKDHQVYFSSLKSLYFIARNFQTLFKVLLKEVDAIELKSYLVTVDSLFWLLYGTQQGYDKNYIVSKEDIASAFSLYFYYGCDKKIIEKSNLNEVNERRLNEKYYLAKLRDFSKIIFFKECEVLVDHFGYTVTQNGNNVLVKAPYERFEMSLRLGYVKHSIQDVAVSLDSFSELKAEALSMYDFAKRYYEKFKESTFRIVDKPLKRVVMQLPNAQPLVDILGNRSVFLEEGMIIKQIEKSFFINFGQIDKIAIYKSLSLFDIIKMQRLFVFIFYIFMEYISSNNLFKTKLFWRSVLPVFQINEFKSFLNVFFGEQKTEEVFELLSWRLESQKIFDLQTYPFINIGNWIILPLGVMTNSNLCRNVLQATSFRFDSESSEDPIVLVMEKRLKSVSSILETNLKYSFQGVQGEIDVLAVIDDCLFVFECKNSLHPCNPFELRTTYDYIQKAASQLTRFCNLWQQEPFRQYLTTKIKTQHSLPSKVYSCIVTGNRMFPGLREQGHSVRPIHELCNIIQTGEILLNLYDPYDKGPAQDTITIKLWKEDSFNAKDLISYINEDSLHSCYFNSMRKIENSFQVNKKFLVQESYVFNVDSFLQQLTTNFRVVES